MNKVTSDKVKVNHMGCIPEHIPYTKGKSIHQTQSVFAFLSETTQNLKSFMAS